MLILFTGRCGCLHWVEPRFCWCKFRFLVDPTGAGLAEVAVASVALIYKLARTNIVIIREPSRFLQRLFTERPDLFGHWKLGLRCVFNWWERSEPRGSCAVL